MAIAMLVDNPDGSQELYDRIRSSSTWRRRRAGSSTSPGRVRTAAGVSSKCSSRKRTRGVPEGALRPGPRGRGLRRPAPAAAVLARPQLHEVSEHCEASRSRSPIRSHRRAWLRVHHGHGELVEVLARVRAPRRGLELGSSRRNGPSDVRLLGRERLLTMTMTGLEPNRLVTYTSTQPGLPDAQHERHFEPDSEGFVYRLVVEYEPRGGVAGVVDRFLLARGIRRTFEAPLRRWSGSSGSPPAAVTAGADRRCRRRRSGARRRPPPA